MPTPSIVSRALIGCLLTGLLGAQAAVQQAAAALQLQPIAFVPNLGQWQRPTRFEAAFGATGVFLEPDGFWLSLAEARLPHAGEPRGHRARLERTPRRGVGLHLQFVGAGPATVAAVPGTELVARHQYFLGADRANWRADVPTYGAVRYEGLYPGVGLRCYARDGHFEYDVELAAGADLAQVAIEVAGAERLRLDADGALVFETALGPVRQPAPSTFVCDSDGVRRPVAASFRLLSPTRFGFAVPEWRGDLPLVVDPGLVYSTTLAGVFLQDVAVRADGVVTLVGDTTGLGYPTTAGVYAATAPGGGDWFVTQLDPSRPTAQQNRYTTYLGGTGGDSATDVRLDAQGGIVIAGYTAGLFPTTAGAFATSFAGGVIDMVVVRLDPAASGLQQLTYATMLGGAGDDLPYDVDVSVAGQIVVAGFSDSPNYPTSANAYDPVVSSNGGSAVVTVLDSLQSGAAQLVYSTFLGGSAGDDARAVAIDVFGRLWVAGYAESTNFPTTAGAFQTTHASPIQADGYVAQLDPSQFAAQQLVWSTLFGGNADDWVDAIHVDLLGTVVTVVGTTASDNLSLTANAFQPTSPVPAGQAFGGYVARFAPQATGAAQLVYGTYLRGTNYEFSTGIAVTRTGAITVTGGTSSTDFPVTPGAAAVVNPGSMSFVSRLDPARPPSQQLVYSTFVGSGVNDYPVGLGVDAVDDELVTIAGYCGSPSYPVTPGAFGTPITGSDLFVTRLDLRPTGVVAYGASSPGCNGPAAVGVLAWPQVGNPAFALTCGNAPASALGIAGLGLAPLPAPVGVLGIDLWLHPTGLVLLTVFADAAGSVTLPLPIPAQPTLAGLQFVNQYAFVEAPGPAPCPLQGWSASNALTVTIQP